MLLTPEVPVKTMNPTEVEVMRILAREGYEARISGDHVEILGRSGRELNKHA